MRPAITVIVTTRNRLHYLRKALQSVQDQTHKNHELIVLDDGSTDGTLDFLSKYNPGCPYSWKSFQSKERSFLRNHGASSAGGDFFAFLDDDDEWEPEKLEKQASFLKDHPDVGLLFTKTTVIDESGSINPKMTREHDRLYAECARSGYSYADLAYKCMMFTSTILITRGAYASIGGYDSRYNANEDLDFYLRFSRQFKINCVPGAALVRYRVHAGNSGVERLAKSRLAINAENLKTIQRDPSLDPTGKAKRAFMLNNVQYPYWLRQYDQASAEAKAFIKEFPIHSLHPRQLRVFTRLAAARVLHRLKKGDNP